jgi:DNA-binding transcriptional LysR family regulator
MEIREIASLAKLATNGSILETARLYNLSSGAVHKHLKSLEAEFDTKLYEKHNRTLRLTPAGKFVLPFLKEVLSQREAAVKALSDWKRAPHGVVRVGAGAAFTSTVLPLILKRFRHRFPEVALYVEVGNRDDLIKGLEDGLLDLTFELDYGIQQHSDLAPARSASRFLASAANSVRAKCWSHCLNRLATCTIVSPCLWVASGEAPGKERLANVQL